MTRATTPLKRVVKLLEYVKDRLQKDKTDTVEFAPEDVADVSLLDSKEGLRIAIETIDKHEDIHARMEEVERMVKTGHQDPKVAPVKMQVCTIHVGNPNKINFYIKEMNENLKLPTSSSGSRLIEKGEDGVFRYQGAPLKVEKGTLYYDVFDILFLHADAEGFLSYEDISKELKARKHDVSGDKESQSSQIRNAIYEGQGFLRYAKVNGKPIPKKTPKGQELIKTVRGKGLQLNNPVI